MSTVPAHTIQDVREKYDTPQVREACKTLHAALAALEPLTPEERELVSFVVTASSVDLGGLLKVVEDGPQ